jgi:DNA-binding MarR family transcriptional regulator
MIEIDSLHKRGYDTQWTQSDYARRMGLKEYAFKRCVKRFVELNLLTVRYNTQGNRVYYSFNTEMYEKLVAILTVTGHVDRLIEFCDTEFKKGGRPIESITPEEIAALGSENKPKKLHPSMEAIR